MSPGAVRPLATGRLSTRQRVDCQKPDARGPAAGIILDQLGDRPLGRLRLSDARGGDPISLAAYLASLSQTEASRNLAEMLRVASSPTSTRTRSSIPCHLTSVRGANTVHALARKTNTHRASLFRKTRPTPIGINCDRRKPRRTDQKTPRQWPAPAVAERPRRTPPPSILPRSPTCRRYASDGSRTAGGREAADWVARTRSARTVMPALPRHT